MPTDQDALLLSVSADVRSLEKQYKKMLAVVDGGSTQMERRAKQSGSNISKALGDIRAENIGRATGALGGFGGALTALGPLGLTAAAGLGAIALALPKVREALDFTDEIADTSARLHVGVEALQAYRFAAVEAGGEAKNFDTSIEGLTSALGKFLGGEALGGKKVTKIFEAVGLTREEVGRARSVEELLPRIADAIASVGSEAERAAIADKLGVRPLLPLLEQGSAKMAEMTGKARDLGLVIDGKVIGSMSDLQRQVEISSQRIDTGLKVAFLGLAPVLVRIAELAAGVAAQIAKIPDVLRGLGGSKGLLANLDLSSDAPGAFLDRMAARAWNGAAATGRARNMKAGVQSLLADPAAQKEAVWAAQRAEGQSLADTLKIPKSGGKGGGAAASKAEAAARAAEQRSRAHDDALADAYRRNEEAYRDETRALLDVTTSVERRAALELQQIDTAQAAARIASEKLVLDLRSKERLGQVEKGTADQVAVQELIVAASRDRAAGLQRQAVAERRDHELAEEDRRQSDLIQGYYDRILQVNLGLARTGQERAQIAAALLASEKRQALAALEAERAAKLKGATAAEATGINSAFDARRASVKDYYGAQGQALAKDALGPLAAWADQAPRTAQEVGEAFERYAVSALDDLNGGIANAIASGESLGDVLTGAFKQAETALIRYLLKQAEIGMFGEGGGGGGWLGALFAGLPKFANGGIVRGAGGPTSDSVVARLSPGELVVPARNVRSAMSGGGSPISFDLRGAVVTEDLLRQMQALADGAAMRGAQGGRSLARLDMARTAFDQRVNG